MQNMFEDYTEEDYFTEGDAAFEQAWMDFDDEFGTETVGEAYLYDDGDEYYAEYHEFDMAFASFDGF